jgi:hypothetical protein
MSNACLDHASAAITNTGIGNLWPGVAFYPVRVGFYNFFCATLASICDFFSTTGTDSAYLICTTTPRGHDEQTRSSPRLLKRSPMPGL